MELVWSSASRLTLVNSSNKTGLSLVASFSLVGSEVATQGRPSLGSEREVS